MAAWRRELSHKKIQNFIDDLGDSDGGETSDFSESEEGKLNLLSKDLQKI